MPSFLSSTAAATLALACAVGAAPWRSELHARPPRSWRLGDATPRTSSASAPAPWQNYTQTQSWFTGQQVDHFNLLDGRTFAQRYWVVSDFWAPPTGPVLFLICGEYTCPGVMQARLFPLQAAYQYQALVVVLEHRFYGQSLPFADLSTPGLAYLNSRQALADLATFSDWFQRTQINANFSLPAEHRNGWIAIGGSYPGALSSWYRLKFPQMTVGAHSSSGVVFPILAFTAFDEQVATTAGPDCAAALRQATSEIEAGMPGVKSLFQASALADGDFYFLVADAAAETMQYAHHHVLCDALAAPFAQGKPVLPAFAQFVVSFFYGVMGNSASDYDSSVLASPTQGGDGRSWTWQTCTEFAWWQIAPPAGSAIRSQNVNLTYFANQCKQVFGLTTFPYPNATLPAVNDTNVYYGRNTTSYPNTFYDNGVEDPWRWAGVQETLAPDRLAVVVDCDDCAHCQPLYTPQPDDPVQLSAVRQQLLNLYGVWLKGSNTTA